MNQKNFFICKITLILFHSLQISPHCRSGRAVQCEDPWACLTQFKKPTSATLGLPTTWLLRSPQRLLGSTDLDRRAPTRARCPAVCRRLPAGVKAAAGQGRRRPRSWRVPRAQGPPPAAPEDRTGPTRPRPAPDLLSAARRSLGAAGSYGRTSQARCHLRLCRRRAGQSRVTQRRGLALQPRLPPARTARPGGATPCPRAPSPQGRPRALAPDGPPRDVRGVALQNPYPGKPRQPAAWRQPCWDDSNVSSRGAFSSTCGSLWSKVPFPPLLILTRHTPHPTWGWGVGGGGGSGGVPLRESPFNSWVRCRAVLSVAPR